MKYNNTGNVAVDILLQGTFWIDVINGDNIMSPNNTRHSDDIGDDYMFRIPVLSRAVGVVSNIAVDSVAVDYVQVLVDDLPVDKFSGSVTQTLTVTSLCD